MLLALAAPPALAASSQSVPVSFVVDGTACLEVAAPASTSFTSQAGAPALGLDAQSAPLSFAVQNCGTSAALTVNVPTTIQGVPLASSAAGFTATDANHGDELDVLASLHGAPTEAGSLGAQGGTLVLGTIEGGATQNVNVALVLGPEVPSGDYQFDVTFGEGPS